jgi:colanic acid/amylovoran biosynthesis protein
MRTNGSKAPSRAALSPSVDLAAPQQKVTAALTDVDDDEMAPRGAAAARILITDTVALNTGDAAILLGTIRTIRAAFGDSVDIEIADFQPAAAARYYPELHFIPTVHNRVAAWVGEGGLRYKLASLLTIAAAYSWRWKIAAPLRALLPAELRAVLEHYAAADVVVAAGGTYLIPAYRLAPRILNFLSCLGLGKPLILFTQSMGPFRKDRDGRLLRYILRKSALILLRDKTSSRYLKEAGVAGSNAAMAADAAFVLAPASFANIPPRKAKKPLRVAISLRNWPHVEDPQVTERYLDAIAGVVRELVETRGAHVTFLSTCQGATEYWTDDSAMADQVARRLSIDILRQVEIDRMHRRPENMIRRLKDFDLIFATRMHAAILALCAARPVIAIAYEFKSRELFEGMGLGELVIDMDKAEAGELVAAMDKVLASQGAITETITRQVASERRAALDAASLVRAAVQKAGIEVWRTR